mgnify:CR=1 FL=1
MSPKTPTAKVPIRYYNAWDQIISDWLANQKSIFTLIGRWNRLSSAHLPEPYYGDADNCSIVIINLNPGIGQPYQEWGNQNIPGVCVNDAKVSRYSGYAKPFPLLSGSVTNPSAKWWKSRKIWIDRIVNGLGIDTVKNPFAIELCPMHSAAWKISNPWNYVSYINQSFPAIDVLQVMEYAILHSDAKLGLAIGKPIFDVLVKAGYKVKTVPVRPITGNSREYSILEKNGIRILCTWAQGGNKAPGAKFNCHEIKLL